MVARLPRRELTCLGAGALLADVIEAPLAQSLIICDSVMQDNRTQKSSLLGIFNSVASSHFPVQIPAICVYATLTNGQGKHQMALRCIRVDTDEEGFRAEGPINFRDPNTVVEIVFRLRNIPFLQPGLHVLELMCEGQHLIEKRFNVIHIPKAQSLAP